MTYLPYLPILFSGMLFLSGIMHLIKPAFFNPLIPPFLPKKASNYLAGVIEVLLATLLLINDTQHWGGLGFMLLMIAFMPLHIWDFMKERPALVKKPIAFIRILIQFLLIYLGWMIFQL